MFAAEEVLEEFADVQGQHERAIRVDAMLAARHGPDVRPRRQGPGHVALRLPAWDEAAAERRAKGLRASRLLRVRAASALSAMLLQADLPVRTNDVLAWPRPVQGDVYLWVRAFLGGREDIPPPEFLFNFVGWGPCWM